MLCNWKLGILHFIRQRKLREITRTVDLKKGHLCRFTSFQVVLLFASQPYWPSFHSPCHRALAQADPTVWDGFLLIPFLIALTYPSDFSSKVTSSVKSFLTPRQGQYLYSTFLEETAFSAFATHFVFHKYKLKVRFVLVDLMDILDRKKKQSHRGENAHGVFPEQWRERLSS